jgi:hypothetical protein
VREEIVTRYQEWEVIGPPEVRGLSTWSHFSPHGEPGTRAIGEGPL